MSLSCRSPRTAIAAAALCFTLGACQQVAAPGSRIDPGAGPSPGATTRVALLVPSGSGSREFDGLADSLEKGARLAIADFERSGTGVQLDVYSTMGTPVGAAEAADAAIEAGADIIVGPLRGPSTPAVAERARRAGIAVLGFSNNTRFAGGNVFLLGRTFENSAQHLMTYAASQGRLSVMIVHAENAQGRHGLAAIRAAALPVGVAVVAEIGHEFSQTGVVDAVPRIIAAYNEQRPDLLVLTADSAGALSLLAQLLPERGIDPAVIQYAGLTRWDIPASILDLKGLQGGWFPRPSQQLMTIFSNRYQYEYGEPPHPIAGLAYDGIAAIGTLVQSGRNVRRTANLTNPDGFRGANGVFRLMADGTIERSLDIAEIVDRRVRTRSPAPRSFLPTPDS